MEKDKVQIDKIYKDKQEQFATLPASSWNTLEQRLDNGKPVNAISYRWLWYALLLLLSITVFILLNSNPDKKQMPNQIQPSKQIPALKKTDETMQKIKGTKNDQNDSIKNILSKEQIPIISNSDQSLKSAYKNNIIRKTKSNKSFSSKQIHTSGIVNPANLNRTEQRPSHIQNDSTIQTSKEEDRHTPVEISTLENKEHPQLIITLPEKPLVNSSQDSETKSSSPEIINDAVNYKGTSVATVITQTDTTLEEENINVDTVLQKNRRSSRFETGVKIGYETGFKTIAINRFIAAPYLQYYLSDRFSVTLQPAIIYGKARNLKLPENGSFYNPTGTTIDTQTVINAGHTYWQYTYSHTYDSITLNYKSNKSSLEIEIPLALRYHLANGISFGAGMNVTFGKLISIGEQRQSANFSQEAIFLVDQDGVHPSPDTSHSFYHSVPLYTHSGVNHSQPSPLRIGYLLGLGYTRKHWNWELTLQQNISGLNNISDQNIRNVYSQPYLRLLLGYRLSK